MVWIYSNLLPFNINNQRLPEAIMEDKINKEWRSIPSGRISVHEAKRLMFVMYAVGIVLSFRLGCTIPCGSLIALGYLYNNCGGADKNCAVRNLINAAGFISFGSGATIVASGGSSLPIQAWQWLAMISDIVAYTVQMQDFPDQEGDRSRGRRTVPLVIGDVEARWTVAIAVLIWSYVAPTFWPLGIKGHLVTSIPGAFIVVRVMTLRSPGPDMSTFKIWNLWMMCLYVLPLLSAHKEEHQGVESPNARLNIW